MSQHYALIAGIDLGDRYSHLCLLDTENGEVIEESRIVTDREAFERRFSGAEPMRVAIEAGTHSPWVSRILEGHGHEVLVANARKVRLIYGEGRKTAKIDAEKLARLARLDPKLLAPIEHRGESSQVHLALIRSRDALVGTRTKLVNHVRGTVKAFGARLPKCTAQSFHHKVAEHLPRELAPALGPVLETIASLSEHIREYDRRLEEVAEELYPETKLMRQVHGVGALTALAFVLTLEDPSRFAKSRQVGPYLGLTPATDQSGKSDPQKRISKHGNELTRKLFWSTAPTTSSVPSARTRISGDTVRRSPEGGERTPRNARWWR
jgi:transposase